MLLRREYKSNAKNVNDLCAGGSCIYVIGPLTRRLADAVGGPKTFSGEIQPGTAFDTQYQFTGNKEALYYLDIKPKYQTERPGEECKNVSAMFWVDGKWISTVGGILRYEENASKTGEDLHCTIVGGAGARSMRHDAVVQVRITNNNNWLAILAGRTN